MDMSVQKSFENIVLLLQASHLFSPEKKAEILDKIPSLSDFELIRVQGLLEQEQKMTAQYYNNLSSIQTSYAQKKLKAVYKYVEDKVSEREEKEENDLLDELALV